MQILFLGALSGGLMLLGYLLYIKQSLRQEINPNPTTWFMFSYGTVILTILEVDRVYKDYGLSVFWNILRTIADNWEILAVPFACSALGIVVAIICFRYGKMRALDDGWDIASFILDACLTGAYLGAWYLFISGQIVPGVREDASFWFLVISNASTLVAFFPIVRTTLREPHKERTLPWAVWSLSYAVLGAVMWYEGGFGLELWLYPCLNAVLHGLVGVLALPPRREKKLQEAAAHPVAAE